ncbi:long polar fimbrial protein LpfD [Salmonella enterica]|nr:long polar fimbrial protein LpfD [Salmonella enterica]
MLKKLIMFTGLLGGSALFSGQVMAAADWGPCETVSGAAQVLSVPVITTITDASKNTSGAVFPDLLSWNLGTTYSLTCECPDDTSLTENTYWRTVSTMTAGHKEGDLQYYIVNNHIQLAAKVYLAGRAKDYFSVPFTDVSNESKYRHGCESPQGYNSGGQGKISLYIAHPFVGEQIIPSTPVFDIYATHKPGVYSAKPVAEVFFSGSITVPQGCELSTGSTLEIPFGEFKASDFKDRKGQMPTGAASITKELQFKCTNISDGIKIFLRIEGMPNASDSNAIDMGNPDIGAVIEGANGKILVPNDASVNQELSVSGLVDDTHRTASTTISAYPISTTGKLPAAGDFEGIATMRIDVE